MTKAVADYDFDKTRIQIKKNYSAKKNCDGNNIIYQKKGPDHKIVPIV